MVLDLRQKAKKPTSWAEAQKQAESEIVEPVASASESGKVLVPRRLGLPVEYCDPDTGDVLSGVIVSEVPDKDGRAKIDALVSVRVGARHWHSISPLEQSRILAIARCTVQIKDAPGWFAERMGEDDDLLFAVTEGLAAHAGLYFRGDDRKGADGKVKPRLVVDFPADLREALQARTAGATGVG